MAQIYTDSLFTIHSAQPIKVKVAYDFRNSFKDEVNKAIKLLQEYYNLAEHD